MPATYTDRLQGLTTSVAVKAPCRVATTAAITLSGLQTVDGIALAERDRVLVKDQASASSNGIWTALSGNWLRAQDFDGSRDVVGGTMVPVNLGTVNGNSFWRVAGNGPATIGTDSIIFDPVSGNLQLQAQLASDSGYTLIKYKRPESGTYARSAAERLLAGIGHEGTYVNEWIDPVYDDQIALYNGGINVNLSPAFNAAAAVAGAGSSRGYTGGLIVAPGLYTLGETVELGYGRLTVKGMGTCVFQQMDSFTDPLFGVDEDVVRPRIFSCDWKTRETWVRNHIFENFGVRGNGSDSDAFWDRGVANSERYHLRARNIGGALLTNLAGVDTYYEAIQSLYAAFGGGAEVRPDWGVIVGQAKIGDPDIVSEAMATQCYFRVRIEQADVAGVWLQHASACQFTGMVESVIGKGALIDAPCFDNEFSHFYCEANNGIDFDISGERNLIHGKSTSYNAGVTTSIKIRSGAAKNVLRDFGNIFTVIDIDSGAEDTMLSNLVTHQINDSGTRTWPGPYIFQNAVSASTFQSQTFGNIADSNPLALDWYQENTFTPTIGGSTTDGTVPLTSAIGRGRRVGNRYVGAISVAVTSVTSAPTGNLLVKGLPFTAAAAQFCPAPLGNWQGVTYANQLSALVLGGTTTIRFQSNSSAGSSAAIDGSALGVAGFTIFFDYEIA